MLETVIGASYEVFEDLEWISKVGERVDGVARGVLYRVLALDPAPPIRLCEIRCAHSRMWGVGARYRARRSGLECCTWWAMADNSDRRWPWDWLNRSLLSCEAVSSTVPSASTIRMSSMVLYVFCLVCARVHVLT